MSNKKRELLLVVIIIILIAGVSWIAVIKNESTPITGTVATSTAPLSTYIDQKYGIQIDYPYFMTATSTFSSSYLLPNSWNVYGDQGTGEQIVDVQYPGSNNILSSEVRVGASSLPVGVASCFTFDSNIATSTRTINGMKFVYGSLSDAAMSHFSTVKSYRTLHNGICFAIDEVTYGTNPEVYSPPKTVPFDQTIAQAVLDNVVASIIFIK